MFFMTAPTWQCSSCGWHHDEPYGFAPARCNCGDDKEPYLPHVETPTTPRNNGLIEACLSVDGCDNPKCKKCVPDFDAAARFLAALVARLDATTGGVERKGATNG